MFCVLVKDRDSHGEAPTVENWFLQKVGILGVLFEEGLIDGVFV